MALVVAEVRGSYGGRGTWFLWLLGYVALIVAGVRGFMVTVVRLFLMVAGVRSSYGF